MKVLQHLQDLLLTALVELAHPDVEHLAVVVDAGRPVALKATQIFLLVYGCDLLASIPQRAKFLDVLRVNWLIILLRLRKAPASSTCWIRLR